LILQVSPDSSGLLRGAAATILILHISAGGIAILSGAAALLFRKGSHRYRMAGNVFFEGANSPRGLIDAKGQTYETAYAFAVVATPAAAGDLRLILRRGIVGAQRIARHLWRMCFALLIAAGSFFLGQQQVFPASVRGSPLLLVPVLAVLALMIFWLCRVRFASAYKKSQSMSDIARPRHAAH
jgi:hypothetical protein